MGLRILVVDDEPLTIEAHRSVIQKWQKGVEIREALDVPRMLEISREWDPDVILLDVRIPGGDGLSALKMLRDEGFSNEAIITTAFDMFSYAKFAMDVRASSFLVKPIRPNHLIEAIEKAVSVIKARRGKEDKLKSAHQFLKANRGPIAMN
ncbi:MAG: response regulator, partial [Syntrophorhabdus aromaticivorans]|nr:response regulator [Syntrophorhabdus aromaticivorans]